MAQLVDDKNGKVSETPYEFWLKRLIFSVLFNSVNIFLILSYINRAGSVGKIIDLFFNQVFGSFYIVPLVFLLFFYSIIIFRVASLFFKILQTFSFLALFLSYLNLLSLFSQGWQEGILIQKLNHFLIQLFDFWGSATINLAIFTISLVLIFGRDILSFYNSLRLHQQEKKLVYSSPSSIKSTLLQKLKLGSQKKPAPTVIVEEIKKIEDIEQPKLLDKADISRKKTILQYLQEEKWKGIDIKEEEINTNMTLIQRTLLNFGIQVKMDEVHVGPRVTQYTLKPKEGTKLSQIMTLSNELALELARHPIRIEAPIPGKSLVGIEVPNTKTFLVKLKNLLQSDESKKYKNRNLSIALGRDLRGLPAFVDLEIMPHLLIAGSTGSGKSICIHNILINLFYKNSPDQLKIILIDPKKVELSVYDGIPYLLTEVVKDTDKVIPILKWLVNEMDIRYDFLLNKSQRDILSYNLWAKKNNEEPMPYIVLMIDELADIMLRFGKEFEALVIRLAQMSRAVGIHLLLSTQRPSTDVITGLIKANITHRIALKTSSIVDSRVILDRSGAEKLLSKGDMLYLDGSTSYIKRIQGVLLTDQEVKNIVQALRKIKSISDLSRRFKQEIHSIEKNEDELLEEAQRIVLEKGFATTSLLQRKLKIGYMRASRLIDLLEEKGIVGPQEGTKPRKVIKKI